MNISIQNSLISNFDHSDFDYDSTLSSLSTLTMAHILVPSAWPQVAIDAFFEAADQMALPASKRTRLKATTSWTGPASMYQFTDDMFDDIFKSMTGVNLIPFESQVRLQLAAKAIQFHVLTRRLITPDIINHNTRLIAASLNFQQLAYELKKQQDDIGRSAQV